MTNIEPVPGPGVCMYTERLQNHNLNVYLFFTSEGGAEIGIEEIPTLKLLMRSRRKYR